MGSVSKLKGWENYPENFRDSAFKPYEYNLASYREQLKDDSSRIFLPQSSGIAMKVVTFGVNVTETILEKRESLDTYLQGLDDQNHTRLILIPQQTSWGHLVVDESSMMKILTRFTVFPPFVEILRSFGQRTGFEDDSAGGIYFRVNQKNSVYETCYLVKQVEEHGRSDSGDPWSIRQMGIYHRRSGPSGNTFILLNPSRSFRRRLRCMQEHGDQPHPEALHAMILSCAMENWRWYITDLEKRYIAIKGKAQLTRMDEKGEPASPTADIRIEDPQEIQVLQDKCQQVAHVLGLDCTVLQEIRHHFASSSKESEESAEIQSSLLSISSEVSIHVKRVEALLKRLDGTIALLRTMLDFRSLASLQHSNRSLMLLTRLTQHENLKVVELTRQATWDTSIMKWITLLTLVYLPASFVSSMMGMQYIKVQSAGHSFSIQFAGEFWVFFVLTVLLLIFTFAIYFWYIRHNRRRTNDATNRYMETGREQMWSAHVSA